MVPVLTAPGGAATRNPPQNQHKCVSQPQVESVKKCHMGVAKRRVCTIRHRPGAGLWPLGRPVSRGISLQDFTA